MSYYAGFAPEEELMEKYNVSQSRLNLNELKMSLTAYCMINSEISSRVYNNISSYLSSIETVVSNQTKKRIYDNYKKEKEVWFCGLQYSKPSVIEPIDNFQYTLNGLYKLVTMVPTPDWYDEEDKFNVKLEEIQNQIENFIEIVEENIEHEVIDYLTENKTKIIGDNKLEENAN